MAASDHPTLGFSRNRKEKPAVSRSNDKKFCIVNFPCCSCTTELNRNLSQNEVRMVIRWTHRSMLLLVAMFSLLKQPYPLFVDRSSRFFSSCMCLRNIDNAPSMSVFATKIFS